MCIRDRAVALKATNEDKLLTREEVKEMCGVCDTPTPSSTLIIQPARLLISWLLLYEITYRTMMGEFIIYYRGKIVGGIYDDRLLVKPTKSAVAYMTDPVYEVPYEGAKEMLLVEEVDQKEFLTGLFHAMYDELPLPKPKKKK